jgi:outer membrane protein TolC
MIRMKANLFMPVFFCAALIAAPMSVNANPHATATGLTFSGAVQLAVGASIELKNAYASLGVSGVVWTLNRYAYFPKLTLTAYEDERLSKFKGDAFLKNYTVGVDQLIFDGGRLLASRKIEKARLAFEEKQIERMADAVASEAVGAYRQVLAARAVLQIQRTGLQALLEQRQVLASEVELGMALRRDLAEADINIAQGKIEIITAEIDLAEIEKQFAETLGLETLPELTEAIDVEYVPALPSPAAVRAASEARNPDLAAALFSIKQKQEELKFARLSWIPTLHASGSFSLAGNSYPLTHYNWSAGLTVEFATPWLSLSGAASAGMEDSKDKTFRMQGTNKLMPDPVSSMAPQQIKIALVMERNTYETTFERLGRSAEVAVKKGHAVIQKKELAIDAKNLSEQKLNISKLKHELGQLTSIELMKDQIEHTKNEAAVMQAVIDVLNVEQELEKLAGLRAGELRSLMPAGKIESGGF